MKILVFGASGMIGREIFCVLSDSLLNYSVYGTVRSLNKLLEFPTAYQKNLLLLDDVADQCKVTDLYNKVNPDIVINCLGITKHRDAYSDSAALLIANSIFPHILSRLSLESGAKLIQISTDCVFSGKKGDYTEIDIPDATDLYGKSKFLGEISNSKNILTIRTSTIGHEVSTKYGLLEWFLSQEKTCKGYSRAYFSGLPTIILAEILRDYVIPNPGLYGLYHVGASSISKFELLKLIKNQYGFNIEIENSEELIINRSLNSSKFQNATGCKIPSWLTLIEFMYMRNKVLNV